MFEVGNRLENSLGGVLRICRRPRIDEPFDRCRESYDRCVDLGRKHLLGLEGLGMLCFLSSEGLSMLRVKDSL